MKIYYNGDLLRSGEFIPGGAGRWCRVHKKAHGRLYICHEGYPDHVIEEIRREDRNWRLSLGTSVAIVVIFVTLLCL